MTSLPPLPAISFFGLLVYAKKGLRPSRGNAFRGPRGEINLKMDSLATST